jgi:hypothetical protein
MYGHIVMMTLQGFVEAPRYALLFCSSIEASTKATTKLMQT